MEPAPPPAWLELAAPLLLVQLLYVITNRADLLILGMFRDVGEVGVFNVAARLADILGMALVATNFVLAPRLAASWTRGEMTEAQSLLTRTTRGVTTASLGLAMALGVFGPWVLALYGPEFAGAYIPLLALVAGRLPTSAVFGSVGIVLVTAGREKDLLVGVAAGAMTNIALNLLLIPPFGALGAASATAVSIVVWNVVLGVLVRRRTGLTPGPWGPGWVGERARMRITVLSPDLSTNCLGRALVLAEILALDHEVRIMGSRFGKELWPPALHHPVEIVQLPGGPWPGYVGAAGSVIRALWGDIVVAVKPRFPSLGLALLARRGGGAPVVLSLDDEETALRPVPSHPLPFLEDLLNPDGGFSRKIMGRAVPHADAVISASQGLRRKYGGELVWHAKDTDVLSPRDGRREAWRARLGLGPEPVILFLGTPRPWKGVEDAAEAVAGAKRKATLLVVGGDESSYCRKIGELPRVRLLGMVPMVEVPGYLEAADIVVIPQRRSPITRFQMPSKLFDAMALAKPILATAVSDIGLVLAEGRGITVPPENVGAMKQALDKIMSAPDMGRAMGAKARAWCIANASLEASREPMKRALDQALAGSRK